MQAIGESIFEIPYLISVIIIGFYLIRNSNNQKILRNYGFMSLILGFGDAFHLIPRVYALWNGGTDKFTAILGFGTLITSITMTIFYLILYYIWRERYNVDNRLRLTYIMWILTALRIILCLMPQNQWTSDNAPLFYAVLRNIPFLFIGIIMVYLFYTESKKANDKVFKNMAIAITFSFLFYFPVVIWADKYPLVGMFMLPKTVMYIWIITMGLKLKKDIQV